MDSSLSPSPNDQRRISTTQPVIGVVPAELGAPSPNAVPQPAPVSPTTLVPSAKTFELMRQLEALAQEVAVVSRGDSSDQCIKVQEGSDFPARLRLVEPSIRVSPHDQVASDSPSFGRRTILTLASFFMATSDWLASYRPSSGRQTYLTLANFFIAAHDWLARYRSSFARRTFPTLANFFIAARDWLARYRSSFARRTFPTLASFFTAALIGVAVASVWQSQRALTPKSANDVVVAEKQSGFMLVGQLSLQDAPPQIAPATQTAPASTAPELVQQLEGMARDLVILRRRVEELAAKQEHLVGAQEQLAARQEQMAQTIAKPQAVKRNINHKMSSPPRRNASPEPAAQALFFPRPRPPLSVPPDR
jgi:hypothetical protein